MSHNHNMHAKRENTIKTNEKSTMYTLQPAPPGACQAPSGAFAASSLDLIPSKPPRRGLVKASGSPHKAFLVACCFYTGTQKLIYCLLVVHFRKGCATTRLEYEPKPKPNGKHVVL